MSRRSTRKDSTSTVGTQLLAEQQVPPGKGSISQLQEFVQGSKFYPLPPSCPILQWSYDTRQEEGVLDFRATAGFLLDGIPHHITGAWRPSKKLAQRDCAEASLVFFVGRWGELAELEARERISQTGVDLDNRLARSCGEIGEEATHGENNFSEVDELPAEKHALTELGHELTAIVQNEVLDVENLTPTWFSLRWDTTAYGHCAALVEANILGVLHTFAGRVEATKEGALIDVAKRLLWYLQCPGFQQLYEPDPEVMRVAAMEIPSPSPSWTKDHVSSFEQGAATTTATPRSAAQGQRKASSRNLGAAQYRRRAPEG